MSLSQTLKLLLTQEANWRRQTINLNASENYTSPLVKQLIGLHPSYDFYTFPPSGALLMDLGILLNHLIYRKLKHILTSLVKFCWTVIS